MKIILITLILTITACGGSKSIAPVGTHNKQVAKLYKTVSTTTFHTVKQGDTLFSISWHYSYDYRTLAKINGIRSPYTIYLNQKIRLRPTKIKDKSREDTKKEIIQSTRDLSLSNASSNNDLTWHWPTLGTILSTYSKNTLGRKGINIAGKPGQSVIAAASGKVVYSGNGLPRYGNLLIIKHSPVYLSAYAHNQTLLVNQGQQVKAGQKIALLGRTGAQQNQLHFEIRKNGRPVNPMNYLPK